MAKKFESDNKLTPQEVQLLQKCADTLRVLSMDGVQKANSGHPGMPMGMADVAATLWLNHLKFSPADPSWADRDRFVLSAGHGSMLLYSLLHMTGYDLPMAQLKSFRQWGSQTPGHPEYGHTPGVETTTGPLGQGLSTAVGMAIAEHWLAANFNRPKFSLFDHYTYVIASDGDLMEGISHEACSLAGHLQLGKLIVLYDDNQITIDGDTSLSFSEDVQQRFKSYGWKTMGVDGHDISAIDKALHQARSITDKPVLIACKTVIGKGSPNRGGTAKAHGEPLGEDEIRLVKEKLGWPVDSQFLVPPDVETHMGGKRDHGIKLQADWQKRYETWIKEFPEDAKKLQAALNGTIPVNLIDNMPDFPLDKPIATRNASLKVLDAITPHIPHLIGGSADLTGSNKTLAKGIQALSATDFGGGYIHYGVREHGMGAIMNGMAVHGGAIPFGGTFLVFSDYIRGSMRLAALMGIRVIYVLTHDSIGLGEDGPTHQPVEHLTALRVIPNLNVIRPADATETAAAWNMALTRTDGPSVLVLTRQNLPVLDRNQSGVAPLSKVKRGGYVVKKVESPDVILMASGSEVHIAMDAVPILERQGFTAQIVSMPCSEVFDRQDSEYREFVLPGRIKARVAVEAGSPLSWYPYVGDHGKIVGIDHYGASAPYETIYEKFGLTADGVARAAFQSIEESQPE